MNDLTFDDEHTAECVTCDHDCPWLANPIGAPFCSTCDDHAEAAYDSESE